VPSGAGHYQAEIDHLGVARSRAHHYEPAANGDRLRNWLDQLVYSKQSRAREDPELFATYTRLAADAREVIQAHAKALTDQLARSSPTATPEPRRKS
jgi:hypothetical protein